MNQQELTQEMDRLQNQKRQNPNVMVVDGVIYSDPPSNVGELTTTDLSVNTVTPKSVTKPIGTYTPSNPGSRDGAGGGAGSIPKKKGIATKPMIIAAIALVAGYFLFQDSSSSSD